jgi:hypothetical protein
MPELRKQPPPERRFIVGLDLGQVSDPSALAVLERTDQPDAEGKSRRHYACTYLKRWTLGTDYPSIVTEVAALLQKLPEPSRKVLCVDQTGVGRPVVDLFAKANLPGRLVGVTITAGHEATKLTRGYGVPKRLLASVTQAVLQTKRIKIAANLKEAKILQRELANFRVKINPGTTSESFEARDGEHDDLVLAVAMAIWFGEKMMHSLKIRTAEDYGFGGDGDNPLPPGWRPISDGMLPPGFRR